MLNETMPLISIIVPAYNIAEYLPRCLDSILNQTYNNLEIIVISDGSTDGTNQVIENYAAQDSRIVPVFKENTGVSDTRNRGLDIAKGEYIGFVDGDDFIEPEMYERLLKNAIEYDADISHCGYQMVFPSKVVYYYNTKKMVIQSHIKGIEDTLRCDYVEPSPCIKIYKSEILQTLRMSKEIKTNEDVLFNFYAFVNAKKAIYEYIPFYHYILRNNSAATSKVSLEKLINPIEVKKEIFFTCKESFNGELISISYNNLLFSVINAHRTMKREHLILFQSEMNRERLEIKKIGISFPLSARMKLLRLLYLYFNHFFMLALGIYDRLFFKNPYEVE